MPVKLKLILRNVRSFLLKNTSAKQTVAKNSIWLSVSNFGGRILKSVVIIYAARVLGTEGLGLFSYAVTLAGFFTLFVDPGINAMLMREGAKANEEEQKRFLSTTFYMKLVLIGFSALFVLVIGPYFSLLPGAKLLLPIAAVVIAGDSIREFFSSYIRAKEKMELEAAVFIFTNICIVILGFLALFMSPTASSFGWSYAGATLLGVIAILWVLRAHLRDAFRNFTSRLVLPILRSAWPFAVTGALGVLLTNADILILSWLRTASEVGVYSAAIRIIQLLYLFPAVVVQYSILPVLSRLAGTDKARFRQIFEKTLGLIFALSIPMAFAGVILGTQIMTLVFGSDYASGGLSLKILMATMIIDYPVAIIASAIFAHDRQKNLIVGSAIAGFGNIILDLLLIPPFGIAGSAVATLLAQLASNIYLWHTLRKLNYFEVLPRVKKLILSAFVMSAAVVLLLMVHVSLLVIIPVGALLYFALLWLMRDRNLMEILGLMDPLRAEH